jgi:hypothetical protein
VSSLVAFLEYILCLISSGRQRSQRHCQLGNWTNGVPYSGNLSRIALPRLRIGILSLQKPKNNLSLANSFPHHFTFLSTVSTHVRPSFGSSQLNAYEIASSIILPPHARLGPPHPATAAATASDELSLDTVC